MHGIDDIISIQPIQNRKNHYFIATNQGLHVIKIQVNPRGNLRYELCPSDEGHDPHSTFPFFEERINGAVQIDVDKVLVAVEGKKRLYVIDISTRRAISYIENPSGSMPVLSLIKHPYFDTQRLPYVFLKDTIGISDEHEEGKELPLGKSTWIYTLNYQKSHSFVSEVKTYQVDMKKL